MAIAFFYIISVLIAYIGRIITSLLLLFPSDFIPEKLLKIYFLFSNCLATFIGLIGAYYLIKTTNTPAYYIFFLILGGLYVFADWKRINLARKQSSFMHKNEISNTFGDILGIIIFSVLMFWLGAFTP